MHRLLIVPLLLLLALPVWAQEKDDADSTDASTTEVPKAADDIADGVDDEGDDEELYAEEDEDAFIPSEDVKFGQSIPFPTDI